MKSYTMMTFFFIMLAVTVVIVCLPLYFTSSSDSTVFEKMLSDIFNKYNVSREMRELYNEIVITPIEKMLNFLFGALIAVTIVCILLVLTARQFS